MSTPTTSDTVPGKPYMAQLKRLTPRHKQIAALLAQGLKRDEVAAIAKCAPEYIWQLTQQHLFQVYLGEMTAAVDTQLKALFGAAVDTLASSMRNGSEHVKLAAAQAVLKANKKDGSQEQTKTEIKFVVHVPPKVPNAEDWAKLHAPHAPRAPRVLEGSDG